MINLPKPLSVALSLCVVSYAGNVLATQQQAIDTVLDLYPAADIEDISLTKAQGERAYDIDFTVKGKSYEAVVSDTGQLFSLSVDEFSSPSAVLGLVLRNDAAPYIGSSSESQLLPYIWYESGNFYIQGKNLGYELFETGGWQFASELNINIGEGYDPDDNKTLADLPELDTPIEFGIVADKDLGFAELEVSFLTDVSGSHKGNVATIGIEKEWGIASGWSLELGAGINYLDQKYVDYFYGVLPRYAIAGRPAYEAEATINFEFEVGIQGKLSDKWYLLSQLEYTRFGSEIKDSPIVDASGELEFSIGVGYVF